MKAHASRWRTVFVGCHMIYGRSGRPRGLIQISKNWFGLTWRFEFRGEMRYLISPKCPIPTIRNTKTLAAAAAAAAEDIEKKNLA